MLTMVGNLSNQEGDDVGTRENLVREFEKKRPAVLTWEKQRNKDPVEAMQASLKKAGIDTEIVEVDPIETAPTMDGSPNPDPNYYIERMRMNIDNLAKALK
jgi:UDP-3-O-acyl-N-acetylglucosamine deacetylase